MANNNYDLIFPGSGEYISFTGYAPQVGAPFGGLGSLGNYRLFVVNGVNGTQIVRYDSYYIEGVQQPQQPWSSQPPMNFGGIVNTSDDIPRLYSDPAETFYFVQSDQRIWAEYQNNVYAWSNPLTGISYGPTPTPACFGTRTQITCIDPSTKTEYMCSIEDIKKDYHYVKVLPRGGEGLKKMKKVVDIVHSKIKIDEPNGEEDDYRKSFFSHKKDRTCRLTGTHGVLVKSLEDHRCSRKNALRIEDVDGFLIPAASSNDFEKASSSKSLGDEEDYYHICVETEKGDYDFDFVFVGSNGDVLAETIQRVKILQQPIH